MMQLQAKILPLSARACWHVPAGHERLLQHLGTDALLQQKQDLL